jgi:hypothetical protein
VWWTRKEYWGKTTIREWRGTDSEAGWLNETLSETCKARPNPDRLFTKTFFISNAKELSYVRRALQVPKQSFLSRTSIGGWL